jgi:orotate phosphoribosyltransferase
MGAILDSLRKVGAVYVNDHFVNNDGTHGSSYVDLQRLYPRVGMTFWLAHALAQLLEEAPEFDVIIGPGFGGNELAEMTAAALVSMHDETNPPNITLVRTRKYGTGFTVYPDARRYEWHLKECRALVVNDVFVTGDSAKKVIKLVERHGGKAVAVAGIIDRGGFTAETFGVETYKTLERVPLESFPESNCPYCRMGRPIWISMGRGGEFQDAHPDYPGHFRIML